MSLTPTFDFEAALLGKTILNISAELGDEVGPDFVIFSFGLGTQDVIVDSQSGDSCLYEIQGDLEHLLETPVTAAYTSSSWYAGECITNFILRTALGEVTFIWVGNVSSDVEVRAC